MVDEHVTLQMLWFPKKEPEVESYLYASCSYHVEDMAHGEEARLDVAGQSILDPCWWNGQNLHGSDRHQRIGFLIQPRVEEVHVSDVADVVA